MREVLHAHQLAFDHPLTGAPIELSAPLPKELARFVGELQAPRVDAEAV